MRQIDAKRVSVKDEHEMTEAQKSPKRPRSRERRKSGGKQTQVDGLGRLENARKRRRDNPPRPKGPRKASISSTTSASIAGSAVGRPPVIFRPEFVSLSADSSRTLGVGSVNSLTPLS